MYWSAAIMVIQTKWTAALWNAVVGRVSRTELYRISVQPIRAVVYQSLHRIHGQLLLSKKGETTTVRSPTPTTDGVSRQSVPYLTA
jgi:hypothetical protein